MSCLIKSSVWQQQIHLMCFFHLNLNVGWRWSFVIPLPWQPEPNSVKIRLDETTVLPPSSARSKSKSEEEWNGSPAKHNNVTSPWCVTCVRILQTCIKTICWLSAITEVLTLKINCGISSLCLSYCFHVFFFTKQNKTHKMSGHFCFLMRMFFCCLVRGGASEHGSRTDRQHSIKSGPRSWIIHLNGG